MSRVASARLRRRASGADPAAPSGRPAHVARSRYLLDVTLHLVRREFATRHRGTLLGWLWSLAPPLLQLAVTSFLFTRVIPLGVENYPVFLLTGILAWSWFSRSVLAGAGALERSRELVLRPGFPTGLLPLVQVAIGLAEYLLALPILLVALAFTTGLHPAALLLPALLLIQLLLSAGIAWFLAPLQVFFRDVQHIAGIAVSLGYWITPVFYRRSQVPHELAWIYRVNPMGHVIGAERSILLEGALPPALPVALVALASLAVFAGGYAYFASRRDMIPENL